MANYERERSTYDPPEDPDVFDGAEDDEEEGSRLPLLIVIALLVLAAFAGVVWLAYSQGVARGRGDTGQVTAQTSGSRPAASAGADTIKPYEQPAPADEDADAETTPSNEVPAPAAQVANPASSRQADSSPRLGTAPAQETTPAPVTQEAPSPPPATAKPAATLPQVAEVKPAAAAAATPQPATEASGSYVLQIGAYKSQAEAGAAWTAYKAKHGSLVAAYSPDYAKADLGPKGVWVRLRVGPFGSKADAEAVCAKLKADGGACFLAK